MKHILEADGIQLQFGERKILTDIYIKSETGRVTGILGQNGEGKSCLMNIMYGTLKCPDKSVRIDGSFLAEAYKYPHLVSYLPQFNFIPSSRQVKNIFKDFKLDFSEFKNNFPACKDDVNTSFGNLSGGSKRLIEVYIIIKSSAKFALLDEPFSHIMPLHIDAIKKIIQVEKRRKGFIITDHLYKGIIAICDDLYLLKNGKLHFIKDINRLEELGYAHL